MGHSARKRHLLRQTLQFPSVARASSWAARRMLIKLSFEDLFGPKNKNWCDICVPCRLACSSCSACSLRPWECRRRPRSPAGSSGPLQSDSPTPQPSSLKHLAYCSCFLFGSEPSTPQSVSLSQVMASAHPTRPASAGYTAVECPAEAGKARNCDSGCQYYAAGGEMDGAACAELSAYFVAFITAPGLLVRGADTLQHSLTPKGRAP